MKRPAYDGLNALEQHQEVTVERLWSTANVFGHKRYMNGLTNL
ncbi:MAG: hypothetical protein ACLR6J_18600 [Parabacteroides merdae]